MSIYAALRLKVGGTERSHDGLREYEVPTLGVPPTTGLPDCGYCNFNCPAVLSFLTLPSFFFSLLFSFFLMFLFSFHSSYLSRYVLCVCVQYTCLLLKLAPNNVVDRFHSSWWCKAIGNLEWLELVSRSQWWRGLRLGSLASRLLGLRVRIPRGPRCVSLLSVVCCQVEVSASGWSFVQRNGNVCVCVWSGATLYTDSERAERDQTMKIKKTAGD